MPELIVNERFLDSDLLPFQCVVTGVEVQPYAWKFDPSLSRLERQNVEVLPSRFWPGAVFIQREVRLWFSPEGRRAWNRYNRTGWLIWLVALPYFIPCIQIDITLAPLWVNLAVFLGPPTLLAIFVLLRRQTGVPRVYATDKRDQVRIVFRRRQQAVYERWQGAYDAWLKHQMETTLDGDHGVSGWLGERPPREEDDLPTLNAASPGWDASKPPPAP